MKPTTRTAYQLLHDGAVTLAQIEANGICIDEKYLKSAIHSAQKTIDKGTERLCRSKVYKVWHRKYGVKTNLGSHSQLGDILFNEMGHECKARTPTGRPKTDIQAFEGLDIPFVKNYLKIEKSKKARNTYLKGINRETVDGVCHPVFNLHLVRTFRGSCDSPNFQNIPVRDPKIGKLVRRCFVSRPGRHLVEIDYGGIEVKVAACYHKDPVMLEYINDPNKDMHRDMAAQCFKCKPSQVGKQERYCGKNMFVFPQFYGSFWRECAENLWDAMTRMNLMVDMIPMKKWLAQKGIADLGKAINHYQDERSSATTRQGKGQGRIEAASGFYKHISDVELDFWETRFKKYAIWKKKWFDSYTNQGYFHTLTGFTISGILKRNEVINYPVQGSAFHCLLWSLIRLQKEIKKRKLKTLLVGQIHDSVIADVPSAELDDFLLLAKKVMVDDIQKEWPWIIVPLEIEAEVAPVDASWFEKKEMKIA